MIYNLVNGFWAIIGIINILFIPGWLLFSYLEKFGKTTRELYLQTCLGLSIFWLMSHGALLNLLGKTFNYPLLTAKIIVPYFFLLNIILFFLAELLQTNLLLPLKIKRPFVLVYSTSLVFMAVVGARLVTSKGENTLLLFFIPFIAITIGLLTKIKSYNNSLIIYAISLSVLLHRAFITNNLLGYDIHLEYYIANTTMANGSWDPFFPTAVNTCLSLTLLPSIINYCTQIELVWVLKIVYPLIFANVPVVIFKLYKQLLGVKGAAIASYLFIVQFVFFSEMLGLARQQIAELLALLSIYYGLNRHARLNDRILGVVFLFATVISHYGLTLILLLIVFPAVLLFFEGRKYKVYLLIFIVFALTWQSYIASGTVVSSVADLAHRTITSAFNDLFGDGTREASIYKALGSGGEELSLPRKGYWLLQLMVQAVILLGFMSRTYHFYRSKTKVPLEETLAMTGLTILILCIVLPYFADGLNVTRIYHISLMFVGYYFAVGGSFLHKMGRKYLKIDKYLITRIILMFYFLFSSGYAYIILGDKPSSIALNYGQYEDTYYHDNEVAAAAWASQQQLRGLTGLNKYSQLLLGEFYGLDVLKEINAESFLFVRENYDQVELDYRPVIYDNGARLFGRRMEGKNETAQGIDYR